MIVPARPATTIILLRPDAGAVSVFLVQRHHRSGFFPRAWVFPGGRVDPGDRQDHGSILGGEAALRAMGLAGYQLIGMIAVELAVTIGTGFAVGTVFGAQVSRMFLPFLRDRASALGDVPPFLVRMSSDNFTIIAGVVTALFVIALGGLAVVLSRLQLSRALKLGEDA